MTNLLIVVDMQNDFINGALGTPEAVSIVDGVSNYINNFDGEIVFTVDTHDENYLNTQEGKKLPIKHCIKGTPGWQISDQIHVSIDDDIYEKNTFGSVELASMIRMNKDFYDQIYICGLCTDICVISNAMLIKAFCPEKQINILSNLCAGVTPESHKNALNAMAMCQMKII